MNLDLKKFTNTNAEIVSIQYTIIVIMIIILIIKTVIHFCDVRKDFDICVLMSWCDSDDHCMDLLDLRTRKYEGKGGFTYLKIIHNLDFMKKY